jgi:hypothetical protein
MRGGWRTDALEENDGEEEERTLVAAEEEVVGLGEERRREQAQARLGRRLVERDGREPGDGLDVGEVDDEVAREAAQEVGAKDVREEVIPPALQSRPHTTRDREMPWSDRVPLPSNKYNTHELINEAE